LRLRFFFNLGLVLFLLGLLECSESVLLEEVGLLLSQLSLQLFLPHLFKAVLLKLALFLLL
jgi:hypothetical protein